MRSGLRDHRRRLDAGRAGADLADALAREIHAIARPLPGVVPLPLEVVQSRNVRDVGGRKATYRCDKPRRRHPGARVGLDRPAVRALCVACSDNARTELNVTAQVELARNVVEGGSNLPRTRVALARLPFGRQLAREEVAVDVALGIAARTGIPVPIPGAAEVATGLEHAHRQPQAIAQTVQLVEPRKARADDQGVEMHFYGSRITEPKSSPGATSPCSPSSIVTRRPL